MAINEQIEVKELPVSYFVTDTYYSSDNYKFTSTGRINSEGNEGIQDNFGTKHIQLVAANTILRATTIDGDKTLTYSDPYKRARINKPHFKLNKYMTQNIITRNQYELALKCQKQGKDFFIYKVSEKK